MKRLQNWLLVAENGVWLLFSNEDAALEWRKYVWQGAGTVVKVLDFPSTSKRRS